MRYTVRQSQVYVLGVMWMPMVPAATVYTLMDSDVDNARDDDGKITRDSLELWLGSHSGDFSEVTDFSASIEDGDSTVDIPWAEEDNEVTYNGCMLGDEG